ncbi:MAG: hypothetical protein R3338_00935 [Thermoanaerobaculia bacterium]|nr:hypothetical protein [Thermoanaerobaculia bacterium]
MLFVLVACLLATPLIAADAIQYEFQQITKTDPPSDKAKVVVGKVFLDQGMSRVDFGESSTAGAGTWVIVRNGGRDSIYVDPETKTYYVHSKGNLSDTLRGVNFEVSNLEIDSKYLGSGPVIAGYPTDHHRMTATYDVSISLGPIPLVQHVRAVMDKWTTLAFGDAGSHYFQGNLPHSGDPEIDRLIEAETVEIPGFPLRQITTVTTKLSESNLPRNSQLQVRQSQKRITELVVTRIGRAESDPSMFRIPAGFKPLDDASLATGSGNFDNPNPIEAPQ